MVKLFFDTYAFIEFVKGNKNYKRYFEKAEIVTSLLNLIELFYILLREYNIKTARKYYDAFRVFTVQISDDIIEQAMVFRFRNKKRDLSYADSIGYVIALRHGITFLTGDRQFKNMKNVRFVK